MEPDESHVISSNMRNLFYLYITYKEKSILPVNESFINQTAYFVKFVRLCDKITIKMEDLRQEKQKIAEKLKHGKRN